MYFSNPSMIPLHYIQTVPAVQRSVLRLYTHLGKQVKQIYSYMQHTVRETQGCYRLLLLPQIKPATTVTYTKHRKINDTPMTSEYRL